MQIDPLRRDELGEAQILLAGALPHDHVSIVAEEKLFGSDGMRTGVALGAREGGALVGVLAQSGRWVKLLAVSPEARGRGVATALLQRAREQAGGRPVRIFDHPGNYLSPGLDARYEGGRRFLERRGFQARGEVLNLRAPVEENPLVTEARAAELTARAEEKGYRVTRVGPPERAALLGWAREAFASVWAHEIALALTGPRRAVHVALAGGRPVAFAAADGNNQGLGWFGPAGTDPAHRGHGLGEALLLRCLLDVKGLPEAGVIAWIGPMAFYARACGAVEDRRFVQYEEGA